MTLFEQNITNRGFTISKSLVCGDVALYIDTVEKMWTMKGSSMKKVRRFSFEQIINCELIENKKTVSSGRTGSALLGGLLGGVTGAVIGSAGSKRQTELTTSVTLRITVNDIDIPVVNLLFAPSMFGDNSKLFSKAEAAYGLFSYMKENA